jgi:hypothetical protein
MSDPAAGIARPALLFIPDISGFTQFVEATEISHSRHIIEELLEILIDADRIGLQVSEVEGDAILFYRFGEPPTAEEFFAQVRTMFVAFHSHLRLYETQRICQCGACASAHSLTLKIVAHHAAIARSRIRDHDKLFGQGVIAVHRLLKNAIAHHEYALFTDALASIWPDAVSPAWAEREEGSNEYDLGRIDYGHVPLSPLHEQIPEPLVEDYSIPGVTAHLDSCECVIASPMDRVFGIVCDLPVRLKWRDGAKEVELLNDKVNRIGTKHRCLIDRNSPVLVTSGITRSADTITLTETDDKRTACAVYTLRQEEQGETRVRIDFFVKNSWPVRTLFRVFLRKNLMRSFRASLENLKSYCEEERKE